MPEYLHPGVYIEETSFRGKPIQGVSTSTAGFVGAARKGRVGSPQFVSSYAHFRRLFGEPLEVPKPELLGSYLGHGVKSFFENGGARCWVVRVLGTGALRASATFAAGTVLKLVPGVIVRGPADTMRLNSMRGVSAGSVLAIYTRKNADGAFTKWRTVTVQAQDAVRGSITLEAASAIPGGTSLDPEHTILLVNDNAPAAGTGPVFTARNPGQDGNTIRVEIRPRDRPPVSLVSSGTARGIPLVDVDPASYPLLQNANTLRLTAGGLRRLRVGDELSVGGSSGLAVQAIADGDVSFTVDANGKDFTGGAKVHLVRRAATALPVAIELGDAPAALNLDLSGAGPFANLAVPHEWAALLRSNDKLRFKSGPDETLVTLTGVRVAQEIAAGDHVTLATGLARREDVPVEARITGIGAGTMKLARLFVADASGFADPARTGSAEKVAVSNGTEVEGTDVLLVDRGDNLVFVAAPGGVAFPNQVTLADWATLEQLQVGAAGQTVLRVSSTVGFYSGAKVELDTGAKKLEAEVKSVDPAARTVELKDPLGLAANETVELAADPEARAAWLRMCEFDLLVYEGQVLKETFERLSWNADPNTDASLRYYPTRINDPEAGSQLVTVAAPAGAQHTFANAPATTNGQSRYLENGSNGGDLSENDLIGKDEGPGRRTGIEALAERDDIAMIAAPGVSAQTVQAALITQCERLKYRLAVLDAPLTADDVSKLQAHRNRYDTSYAAYYSPWIKALNSQTGRIDTFPPAPYAMGIYARSDNTVGVHKAPANEVVRNISDLVLPFTAAEQDVLNPVGINLIRDLTPRGIRVWGARTLTSDPEWMYLNVRRLFIFLEHSIDLGTQWVVFEPNSDALWARVVETINSFLFGVWKTGALMGTTPEQAYFITCDRTTMTQDDIDNGRLICLIGVAPVKPAEFVIFRIGQFTAKTS